MKICDLIAEINGGIDTGTNTCDTVKAGDAQRDAKKIAVTMFATVEIVKQAQAWGADLLLVHEPTYYHHMDEYVDEPIANRKRELIAQSGLTIYRYHDHPHAFFPDKITEGVLHFLGLNGKLEKTPYFAAYKFTADEPLTALELAKRMEEKLHIRHVRIAGERNKKSRVIAACCGTPGGVSELLHDPEIEILITGELYNEWNLGEYARDCAALGVNKSALVMGHIGSERAGMELLAERLQQAHPELEIRYMECGEVYSYTDSE